MWTLSRWYCWSLCLKRRKQGHTVSLMQSAWDQAQTISSSDRATVSAVSEPAVLDLMFQSNLLHLWATKATAAEAGGRILWKNVRKSVVSVLNIWATNSATAEINYVSFKAHREIAGVRPWTGVFKETFFVFFLERVLLYTLKQNSALMWLFKAPEKLIWNVNYFSLMRLATPHTCHHILIQFIQYCQILLISSSSNWASSTSNQWNNQ